MKLILEILHHGGGDEHVTHRIVEEFPVLVGRGFHNDIILSDPHVSARHLRIDHNGENWVISDLGSDNGTTINRASLRGAGPARSGDSIHLGMTEIRFYSPHHTVAATLPMTQKHPLISWLEKPLNAWSCFILALAVTQCWTFLEIWTDEIKILLAGAAASAAGATLVWASLWSVAGRLIKNRPAFLQHTGIFSLYLIAGVAAWYVETYANFLTNEAWIATFIAHGMNFSLMAALVCIALDLASKIQKRKRLFASFVFSAAVTGAALLLNVVSAKNFNQEPLYPATLEPYLSSLASATDAKDFIRESGHLFSASAQKE